jgi:hypothetical protein
MEKVEFQTTGLAFQDAIDALHVHEALTDRERLGLQQALKGAVQAIDIGGNGLEDTTISVSASVSPDLFSLTVLYPSPGKKG